jgi:hypothetical protein
MMHRLLFFLSLSLPGWPLASGATANAESTSAPVAPAAAQNWPSPAPVTFAQMIQGDSRSRFYPGALESLLLALEEQLHIPVEERPVIVSRFDDEALRTVPFIYLNFADRTDWELDSAEREGLRNYLERGGFLYIDAGINAQFLRGAASHGQRHSYASWEPDPTIEEVFRDLYPQASFRTLPRTHPLFQAWRGGLPDPSTLPESIRDYIINEKWPQGTYSMLGLEIEGRIGVLLSPIIAMGWARTEMGLWANPIGFRVRESAEGLDEQLRQAAYSGVRYEVPREDGRMDVVYCQPDTMPAWVQEPDGRWRIFRYHTTQEVSDYAHVFYTQLGLNVLTYALLQ